MRRLPGHFTRRIGPSDLRAVRAWWRGLSDESRAEVGSLCETNLDTNYFGVEPGGWSQGPRVRRGHFVPRDDTWGLTEWGPDYFQHLLDHPELMDFGPAVTHVVGCIAHPAARACLESGRIPVEFGCPVGSAACPMRRIVDAAVGPGPVDADDAVAIDRVAGRLVAVIGVVPGAEAAG